MIRHCSRRTSSRRSSSGRRCSGTRARRSRTRRSRTSRAATRTRRSVPISRRFLRRGSAIQFLCSSSSISSSWALREGWMSRPSRRSGRAENRASSVACLNRLTLQFVMQHSINPARRECVASREPQRGRDQEVSTYRVGKSSKSRQRSELMKRSDLGNLGQSAPVASF